jgi:hypothetical protein
LGSPIGVVPVMAGSPDFAQVRKVITGQISVASPYKQNSVASQDSRKQPIFAGIFAL